MKKFLVASIIVFLLILTVLTVFRLEIVEEITVYALKQAGITNIEISPSDLSLDALVINHFSCSLPKSGIHLSASRIHINWTPTIITSRQVTGVSVDSLTLNISSTTNQTTPMPLPQRIASFVRQLRSVRRTSLKPFLPFQNIHLKKLIITGKNTGPISDHDISLDIENKTNGLFAQILLPQEQLQLDIDTVDSPGLTLKLHKVGQAEFATTNIILHDRNMEITLKMDLAGLSTIYPLLSVSPPKSAGILSGRLNFSLHKQLTLDSKFHLVNFNLSQLSADTINIILHAVILPEQGSLLSNKLTVDISNLHQPRLQAGRLKFDLQGLLTASQNKIRYIFTNNKQVEIKQLTSGELHVETINLPASMNGVLTTNGIQLTLAAKSKLRLSRMKTHTSSLAKLAVIPLQDTTITSTFKDFTWAICPGSWRVTAGTANLPKMSLDLQPLTLKLEQLTGTSNKWRMRTKLTCPAIQLHASKNSITLRNISTELHGDSTNIHGQGFWSLNTIPGLFSLKLRNNLKTGRGRAVIATRKPLILSKDTPLSAALTPWPLPGDLTRGKLQVKSTIRWQPLEITGRISLINGKGYVKDIKFSGLSTSQDMQIFPFIQSIKPGTIAVNTIDLGLPIHNFSTKIRFKPSGKALPEIILDNTRASLLGGTVFNDYLQIDPQNPDLQTTIRLKNIQLADVLTLQKVKGLRVTGSVQGELPIRLDKEGLHVDTGRLTNEKHGGIIEYHPAEENAFKNSPFTDYALKALEEFHYKLLSASVAYSPDGALAVKLHLEGKSPKLDTSRPVHINISTEENLLSLLRSLRYSTSLTNEIDREIQHHFHSKPSP